MGNDCRNGDNRRHIPGTDVILAMPEVQKAAAQIPHEVLKRIIHTHQNRARAGQLPPEDVIPAVLADLTMGNSSTSAPLRPVINATGVVIHTNLGRAPLSPAAYEAIREASGYTNVEFDLSTGQRSQRGAATLDALLMACPQAESALVVNNAAGALLLAATALASQQEILLSRGEFIEIGAGFRLPELITAAGARIREVGTTNRTHLRDFASAITPDTACIMRIHPSNFTISGFTSEVPLPDLVALGHDHNLPVIADIGSGLLRLSSVLPDEPDFASTLATGVDIAIASGDKLLGGPQAGIILGKAEAVHALATHPLARAVRADKLTLAALSATVRALNINHTGNVTHTDTALSGREVGIPVWQSLHATPDELYTRTQSLAESIDALLSKPCGLPEAHGSHRSSRAPSQSLYTICAHDGRAGGGGGAEVPLPGWALALPGECASRLRQGSPPVVTHMSNGRCLVDLRCVPHDAEPALARAIAAAL